MLSRTKARKQAFFIVFEHCFHDEPLCDILEAARETREFESDAFTEALSEGVISHVEELDKIIDTYAIDWKRSRISKVSLALLRLSIYELKYLPEMVPTGVSINEAVELAKKYASEEDASFINGILGSFVRAEEPAE